MRIVAAVAATVRINLLARAQLDITRRDPALIRGSKRRWRLICLVNFVGPLAYFRWGRIDPAPTDPAAT